jgi:hypothetical protein
MVYTSLLESVNEHNIVAVYRRGNNLGYPAECTLAHCHPHVIDPEYVGVETRLELIKMWYRSSVIILGCIDDVTRLVAYDPWSVHLDPRQHVRNIKVDIVPYYEQYMEEPQEDNVRIFDNFDQLLQLQAPVRLTISLELRR